MISEFQTIPQVFRQVKFKSVFFFCLLCLLPGTGVRAASAALRVEKLKSPQFQTHENYLSMELRFEPIAEVRKKIEQKEALTLKHRGEAHVTVLTPPEYEKIKAFVSMKDINEIALQNQIQKADFQIQCVGKAKTSPDQATYFLVIQSKALLKIRLDLENLLKSKKAPENVFQASHFYPHITVGFKERDLHESDGVIKDERACDSQLSAL